MHFEPESLAGNGGFMMSQPGGLGNAASPAKTGGKDQGSAALRPVTMKQLNVAQRVGDGAIIVDGREVGQITVVGRIVQVDAQAIPGVAKMFTCLLSDGTGSVLCKKWLDAAEAADPEWRAGNFLRVYGSVKMHEDRPQVTGQFRVVSDHNELTYHLLEAVHVHLRLTRPPPAKVLPTQQGGANSPAAKAMPMPTNLTDAIKAVAAHASKKTGMTWEEIHRAVGTRWGAEEVRQETLRLVNDGRLLTVMDERHFMC